MQVVAELRYTDSKTTPTKQVTTSVDAVGVPLTDAEPPTKIGGRSKGRVGSENEPVETAPGDEELNISEKGVTVATATTIFQEVTDSTEVGGVPTTDPPMSEVPNNDEGGVKTRTDATEPSNTTLIDSEGICIVANREQLFFGPC